jgi:hypothetical protein
MAKSRSRSRGVLGSIDVVSPQGVVEVLPGYRGPRDERDVNYKLAPRVWSEGGKKRVPQRKVVGAVEQSFIQVDGRSYTIDQTWSGLRFLIKVDQLSVGTGETEFNLFTTHLGHTINNVPNWTEIGIARALQDPEYRLYTYDPYQDPQWSFFGTVHRGEVFEFVIRVNEDDAGPYRYETICNGIRVRSGTLPSLGNQVDISHESWSTTGTFSTGDYVMAVEGWLNYPPGKARWYAPDVPIDAYSGNTSVKHVQLGEPFAFKFDSST